MSDKEIKTSTVGPEKVDKSLSTSHHTSTMNRPSGTQGGQDGGSSSSGSTGGSSSQSGTDKGGSKP